jgi:alkanesulfonate monooxygenase SsuD/methylene tetrahydromethanopterin reductase-like flavin-dependent oxidoreductase (luciferase family)
LGFEAYHPSYHLIPNTFTPGSNAMHESYTVMAAAAAVTTRVRLGPLVQPVMVLHPVMAAKMYTTLDHVSNGRAIIGLGLGGFELEYTAYGIPLPRFRERAGRLEEALQVMLALFTQERATFQGKYYTLTDAPFDPKPVQKPHPPVLIAGRSPSVLRIAARYADDWNCVGSVETVAEKSRELDTACAEVGRDPRSIRRSRQIPLMLTDSKAELEQFVDFQTRFLARMARSGLSPEAMRGEILKGSIAGGVEEVKEAIGRWREVGVTHLNFNWPRRAEGRRPMLERFMQEVAPAFQ